MGLHSACNTLASFWPDLSTSTAPSPWGHVDPSLSVWLFLSLKELILFGISCFCLAAPQLPAYLLFSPYYISTCRCVCACVCGVLRLFVLDLIWIILKCFFGY